MKKRLLCLTLAFLLVLPLLMIHASAEQLYTTTVSYTSSHAKFEDAFGTIKESDVTVLRIVGDKPLTKDDCTFIKNKFIHNVALNLLETSFADNTVPESAFEGFTNLRWVQLPGSVSKIDRYAFKNCAALTSCYFNSGLEEIGAAAFENCLALSSITLPETIKKIGGNAFNMCISLGSVLAMREDGAQCEVQDSAFANTSSSLTLITDVNSKGYESFGYLAIAKKVRWQINEIVESPAMVTGYDYMLGVDVSDEAGVKTPAYQWSLNGFDIYGANEDSIIITGIDLDHSGRYTVAVTIDGLTAYFSGVIEVVYSGTPSAPFSIKSYSAKNDMSNYAVLTDTNGSVLKKVFIPSNPTGEPTFTEEPRLSITTDSVSPRYEYTIRAARLDMVKSAYPSTTFTIKVPESDTAGRATGRYVTLEVPATILDYFQIYDYVSAGTNRFTDYNLAIVLERDKNYSENFNILSSQYTLVETGVFWKVSFYLKKANSIYTAATQNTKLKSLILTIPQAGTSANNETIVQISPAKVAGAKPYRKNLDGSYIIKVDNEQTYAAIKTNTTFSDTSDNWAKADIEKAAARLLVNGVGSGRYAPEQPLTRAQYCVMLLRSMGYNSIAGIAANHRYNDIKSTDWYYDYVNFGQQLGLFDFVKGDKLEADAPLTREEMAYMTYKSGIIEAVSLDMSKVNNMFRDANTIGSEYRQAVAACVNSGILVGTGGNFSPASSYTRAQAATVLNRLFDYMG